MMKPTSVLAQPSTAFHQCNKTFNYQLYFNNLKIGQFTRTLNWKDSQANINSYSTVNVLATKTRFRQQSIIYWSAQQQSFLTKSFKRDINGLLGGSTQATFSNHGLQSEVSVDGTKNSYTSNKQPLLDADAIGSQIRLMLIEGKTQFNFKMQDTDEVNHYYFQVKGKETINSNFGKIRTIRVEQIKKNDRKFVMWFSPDIDYQLVRATYQRKILDLKAVMLSKRISCPPQQVVVKTP
ncbi:hypothetical protein ABT56_01340 [Photobacterium aquae]|uniref:DUF3108 domain-containing protein n=1 Tax=Photobacterium aquae TaxID=1195763 RepID=A0A0J1HCI3_9GAMM|nr:DUF3108 domain-containing protein [Photobacterium aquae]KLV09326.1 hypothetical protein ABT56_01340 [Photobacterium aquae]